MEEGGVNAVRRTRHPTRTFTPQFVIARGRVNVHYVPVLGLQHVCVWHALRSGLHPRLHPRSWGTCFVLLCRWLLSRARCERVLPTPCGLPQPPCHAGQQQQPSSPDNSLLQRLAEEGAVAAHLLCRQLLRLLLQADDKAHPHSSPVQLRQGRVGVS